MLVWLPALLAVLTVVGCGSSGPATVPVTGTILLDGNPVEGATVMFIPTEGGRMATGTTDASGQFTLTTFEKGDGAIIGSNKVAVSLRKVTGEFLDDEGQVDPDDPRNTVEWVVPMKYCIADTSGLTCEVAKGMEPPTFDLKSE